MNAADRWAPVLQRRRLGTRQVWILGLRDRRTGRETPILVSESAKAARRRRLEALDDLLLLDEEAFAARWLAGKPPTTG